MPSGEVMWLLTRREDICAVATDHHRFTRNLTYPGAPRIAGEDFNSVKGGIFNLDPPDHTRIRTILTPTTHVPQSPATPARSVPWLTPCWTR